MTKYCVTLEGVSRKQLMSDINSKTPYHICCLKNFIEEDLNREGEWSSTIDLNGSMADHPNTILFIKSVFLENEIQGNSRGGQK